MLNYFDFRFVAGQGESKRPLTSDKISEIPDNNQIIWELTIEKLFFENSENEQSPFEKGLCLVYLPSRLIQRLTTLPTKRIAPELRSVM